VLLRVITFHGVLSYMSIVDYFSHSRDPCESSDFITTFHRNYDKESSDARHPVTRKQHTHGLWSVGPNEEWCVDGHEKILLSMGIVVYSINDKYSRKELCLEAMPSARVPEIPSVLYLRLVRVLGGLSKYLLNFNI
jgi:hypothetical protein